MNTWREPDHERVNNLATWLRVIAKHLPSRTLRQWIYRKFLVAEMGAFVRIGMDVEIRFPRNLAIGNNVQINDGVFFMNHGHITLGDGVLVAPGVKFLTVYHDYEHAFLLDDQNIPCWKKGRPEFLPITVEHEVWIGANVVLLPGCHIGHHSVIAANSVVSGRTEPFSLIGGNPARHIKKFKELGEINRL